jgi:hypothetical protein
MSRYNNPNSKRKQKASAKARAAEMCKYHSVRKLDESTDAPWCISPDEFVRREQEGTFTKQEVTVIKKKRKHHEPKLLSAAA